MKTQEEVVRQHAIGPINIYKIYQEGYQDRELDDWVAFRREAAKDILCAMNCAPGPYMKSLQEAVHDAIEQANELIKQLKEEQK